MFDPPVYVYEENNIKACVRSLSEMEFELHINRDGLINLLESLDYLGGRVRYYESASVWSEHCDSFPSQSGKVLELLHLTVIPLEARVTSDMLQDGRIVYQPFGSGLDIYVTTSEALDAYEALEVLSQESAASAQTRVLSVLNVTLHNHL
jgi:hypothetical protein